MKLVTLNSTATETTPPWVKPANSTAYTMPLEYPYAGPN